MQIIWYKEKLKINPNSIHMYSHYYFNTLPDFYANTCKQKILTWHHDIHVVKTFLLGPALWCNGLDRHLSLQRPG